MCSYIFDIMCLVLYILRCVYVLRCFSHVWLFETLWTVACQAPLSMGFSKQEFWNELPCPLPGNLSYPVIELSSPAAPALQVDSLPLSHQKGKEREVVQSCPTLWDPMDCSLHQAPVSMGFSRQEYWSRLPFPSPGNLPDPGIKSRSPTL